MNESVLNRLKTMKEVFWLNEGYENALADNAFDMDDIEEAENRLKTFAPLIRELFPETRADSGIIESPVERLASMQEHLDEDYGMRLGGELFIKRDDILPISGSVKARGGIYEILKYAESLAVEHG